MLSAHETCGRRSVNEISALSPELTPVTGLTAHTNGGEGDRGQNGHSSREMH